MLEKKHNILIVDDHELAVSGIKLLLSNHIQYQICASLDKGNLVVPYILSHNVDIILLDLNLPDINGMNLLAELVSTHYVTVIILTGENDAALYKMGLRLGARAIVNKADKSSEILDALEAASQGVLYRSSSVIGIMGDAEEISVNLSTRQMAMLQFLAQGVSNKEIGYRLKIAAPTVSFHLAELRRKLNVSGNSQIIDKARAEGLL